MSAETSSSRKVAAGALVLMAFQFASKAFFLVFFVLLGNRALFSDESYGRLEGLLALANLFFILTDLGLEVYLTRELSRDHRETLETLPPILSLKLVLTLLAGLLLGGCILLNPRGEGEGLDLLSLLACVAYLGTLSAQSLVRSISRSYQRMEIEGMMGVVEKAVTLVVGGALLWRGAGVAGVMGAIVLGTAVSVGYGAVRVRALGIPLRIGWPMDWGVLWKCLPFGLSAVCVLLFYNMDRMMLFYFGEVWAARYARGFRVVMGLLLFPQMMSIAIYPALSKLKDLRAERMKVGRGSLQTLMFVSFPLVAGGWVLSGPLVDFLYGAASPDSLSWRWDGWLGGNTLLGNTTESAVLRVLLLSLPFTCGNYLFGPALNALDKQVWNLYASAATALANVVLNFALIPWLGPVGAALATSVSQGIYCWGLYRGLQGLDDSWLRGNRLVPLGLCALAMGGLVHSLPAWSLWVRIALGMSAYLGGTGLLGLWPYRFSTLVGRFQKIAV